MIIRKKWQPKSYYETGFGEKICSLKILVTEPAHELELWWFEYWLTELAWLEQVLLPGQWHFFNLILDMDDDYELITINKYIWVKTNDEDVAKSNGIN